MDPTFEQPSIDRAVQSMDVAYEQLKKLHQKTVEVFEIFYDPSVTHVSI